ncbi:MAG: GNAT family N-acetyltransferase [Myxococcales bacterium]|nr:GNAT family N-acetyltransferase [Myxococcales bacterium]
MRFRLRLFDAKKDRPLLEDLTRMLHTAYRPLAERGMRYLATHQAPHVTASRLSKGEGYVGFVGETLMATASLVRSDANEPCEWYQRPNVFFFTQFAVDQAFQGHGYGQQILDFLENRARESGAEELALDTSERASDLIAMYRRRDYRFVQEANWSATNYKSVVLSKAL